MKLQGVILDWAGTIIDHGSRAPVATLQSVFAAAGVPITVPEARLSMGIAKRSHIQSILELPRVRQEWEQVHGHAPELADLDELYAQFIPKQLDCLGEYAIMIPGAVDAVDRMRAQGLKIGTTTGYTRPMLDFLLHRAREQGFFVESALCPDDAPAGRPAPWMCYLNAIRLNAFPLSGFVKIGDTPSDIEEGRNAGMWTIGVTRTGNEAGLTEDEWHAASPVERSVILATAGQRLLAAGAHYLAESVAECDDLLEAIQLRLSRGERPEQA